METGSSSMEFKGTLFEESGSDGLSDDDKLYYYLLEGGATPSWAKEQMSILNRMRYLDEKTNNMQRSGNPYFQQCNKCGKFTGYLALDHDCYQDRCALCGKWSDSRHACSSSRCPICGEFSSGLMDHSCKERWQFRCSSCGLFTGSGNQHKCQA